MQPNRRPTIHEIKRATAHAFHVTVAELDGRCHEPRYARPRHVAMYLARIDAQASFPRIGRAFGGRDHTTAIYACNTLPDHLSHDPQLAERVHALRRQLAKPSERRSLTSDRSNAE